MLRSAARRGWRLARPFQAAPAGAFYGGGKTHAHLALRNFSSTLSTTGIGSDDDQDCVKIVKKRKSAWQEKVLAALRAYKEVNGDLLVPSSFVVPHGDSKWPPVAWGCALGNAVVYLRGRSSRQELPPQLEKELEELGFVYDKSQYRWDHIILPALRKFYQLHGDSDVPQEFVVPTGDEAWPVLAWGLRLGSMVSDIRQKNTYSAQVVMSKQELDRMEFCHEMTITDRNWKEKILPSFQVYYQVFGDCIIPIHFIVPSYPPWPEKAWGMPLGKKVVNEIRVGKSYAEQALRDKDELDSLGFAWDRDAAVWNDIVMPALEVYVSVYKRGKVPQPFVVPSVDPWPRKAWAKKLGRIFYDVRYKATYLSYFGRDIDKLHDLGLKVKLLPRAWNERVAPLLDWFAGFRSPLDSQFGAFCSCYCSMRSININCSLQLLPIHTMHGLARSLALLLAGSSSPLDLAIRWFLTSLLLKKYCALRKDISCSLYSHR